MINVMFVKYDSLLDAEKDFYKLVFHSNNKEWQKITSDSKVAASKIGVFCLSLYNLCKLDLAPHIYFRYLQK